MENHEHRTVTLQFNDDSDRAQDVPAVDIVPQVLTLNNVPFIKHTQRDDIYHEAKGSLSVTSDSMPFGGSEFVDTNSEEYQRVHEFITTVKITDGFAEAGVTHVAAAIGMLAATIGKDAFNSSVNDNPSLGQLFTVKLASWTRKLGAFKKSKKHHKYVLRATASCAWLAGVTTMMAGACGVLEHEEDDDDDEIDFGNEYTTEEDD